LPAGMFMVISTGDDDDTAGESTLNFIMLERLLPDLLDVPSLNSENDAVTVAAPTKAPGGMTTRASWIDRVEPASPSMIMTSASDVASWMRAWRLAPPTREENSIGAGPLGSSPFLLTIEYREPTIS